MRLNTEVQNGSIRAWSAVEDGSTISSPGAEVAYGKIFEFSVPLAWLYALPRRSAETGADAAATKLRLRFSIWQNKLPVDALPVEGWMELQLLPEDELIALGH